MKMFDNVLEGGALVISRLPIQSPRFTKMGEVFPPCAVPPPEHPAQVRHLHHHAEEVAVAVDEHVDVVDDREQKKDMKQRPPSNRPSTMCGKCRSAMCGKCRSTKRKHQQRRRRMKGGTGPFIVDFKRGFQLLTNKDMWKIPSKAEEKTSKRRVAAYKREYRASGTKDSFNKWAIKKGYAKIATCSLM